MAHLQTDGARVFSLWHNGGITSRLKRPRDLAQLAKLMIDIASGEVKDHESPQKKTTKRKLFFQIAWQRFFHTSALNGCPCAASAHR
jgi:hypothetical protein